MPPRLHILALLLFTSLLALSMSFQASAHATSGSEAFVRTVSANPETKTYTFSCSMDPDTEYVRDWFIRPDDGDDIGEPEEATFNDVPAGEHLTYTFEENTFYHVGCLIVNNSNFSQQWRGDLHIDLRNNGWDPEIIPQSGDGLTATYLCDSSGDYPVSWESLNAQTGQSQSLGSSNPLTHTVEGHGLYDYVCHVSTPQGTETTGLPIEYFDQGDPYFPDDQGVPHGITNVWLRDTPVNNTDNNQTNGNQTNPPTNTTNITSGLTRIDTDGGLAAQFSCKPEGSSNNLIVDWNFGDGTEIYDVSSVQSHSYDEEGFYLVNCGVWDNQQAKFSSLTKFFMIEGVVQNDTGNNQTNTTQPNNTQTSYNSLQDIPASCTGGSIVKDEFFGGRRIECASASGQITIVAWDKPDQQTPQYFEMYKSSQSGAQLKVCIANTCISDNGFARSPNYPIIFGGGNQTTPPTNDTNQTGGSNQTTNQTGLYLASSSGLTANYVCKPAGSSNNLVVDWNFGDGTEIYDVSHQQSHTYSSAGTFFVSCGAWDNQQAEFTNLYRAFTLPQNTSTGSNQTNQSSFGPPQWLSHTDVTGVSPTYFHLEVNEPTNTQVHASTDWEIWQANQLVWSSNNKTGTLRYHIHTPDGTFTQNKSQLDFSTAYAARARFMHTNGTTTAWSAWRNFTTASQPDLNETAPTWTTAPGFSVELFSTDYDLPVHVAEAPNIYQSVPASQRPFLYVTELYGDVEVVYANGQHETYASDLLNFDPFGSITGGGQMGLIGLVVEPTTGDLFVGMVYVNESNNNSIENKIVRLISSDDGRTFTSQQTILQGIPSAPSHQIEQLTLHNGRLYANIGDAMRVGLVQNDSVLVGKIISMNLDGSDVQVYAKGFRNPFGADWSESGVLYVTDNAPDVDDKLARVVQGGNYGWGMNDDLQTFNQQRIATLNVSPVDVEFNYDPDSPQALQDHLFVAVAGPIYQQGPTNGKEILEFTLNTQGDVASSRQFVRYTGTGYGTPAGLEFADGDLYFTDLYGEAGFVGLGETEGNIYRVVEGNATDQDQTGQFRAGLSIATWYPKDAGDGIEYIFICQGLDGSGDYRYDMSFGDGSQLTNVASGSHYKKYPYDDVDYTVSCTVRDQSTSQSTSRSIVVNPSNFISEQNQQPTPQSPQPGSPQPQSPQPQSPTRVGLPPTSFTANGVVTSPFQPAQ